MIYKAPKSQKESGCKCIQRQVKCCIKAV